MEEFERPGELKVSQSWFSVPTAILQEPDIGYQEKLVYMVLLSYAGRTNQAWPRRKRIAAECGLSESSVKRALAKLQERKLLDIQDRYERTDAGFMRQTSNIYTVYSPSEAAERRGDSKTEVQREPGSTGNRGAVHTEPGWGSERTGGRFTQTRQELQSFELDPLKQDSLKHTHTEDNSLEVCVKDRVVGLIEYFQEQIKSPFSINQLSQSFRGLLDKYDEPAIKEKIAVISSMKNLRHPIAALKKALEEDWPPVLEAETPRPLPSQTGTASDSPNKRFYIETHRYHLLMEGNEYRAFIHSHPEYAAQVRERYPDFEQDQPSDVSEADLALSGYRVL